MRLVAPSGTPITLKDLASWVSNIALSGRILDTFKYEICNKFKVNHCFFMSTGRAAMVVLLECLGELSGNKKREVIIPSYTCFSVPSSIVKAGLKIRVCDIDRDTLDYDLNKLEAMDYANVLCIISANLYGIPNNLKKISHIARRNNVFLIDDAAQSMGAQVDHQYSGTLGDAGIYSLDRGKNITAMEGGIIVTNSDDIARLIKSREDILPRPEIKTKLLNILKLSIYSLFLKSHLYWIPAKMPFLNLGSTVYTTNYPIKSFCTILSNVGFRLFQRIDEITDMRVKNAEFLIKKLKNLPLVNLVQINKETDPVYLRLPLLIADEKLRDDIVNRLHNNGISATKSFPSSIADIQDIKKNVFLNKDDRFINGQMIAKQIITLPTHPYVTKKDLWTIVSTIKASQRMFIENMDRSVNISLDNNSDKTKYSAAV